MVQLKEMAEDSELGGYEAAFLARLNDWKARDPEWLTARREASWSAFRTQGFPTTRDEAFRFTNVAPIRSAGLEPAPSGALNGLETLAGEQLCVPKLEGPRLVFVDGFFSAALSRLDALPKGVRLTTLTRAMADGDPVTERHLGAHTAPGRHGFADLNLAFLNDGALIELAQGTVVEEPLQLIYLSSGQHNGGESTPLFSNPRSLIVARASSECTIVETYLGAQEGVYWTNALAEIVLEENAGIEHTRIGLEKASAFHTSSNTIHQQSSSRYTSHSFTAGGALVRNDIDLLLDGEHCVGTLNGLYMPTGRQLVDHHTRIEHARPNLFSHELYKGILDDQARAVFNGRIFVEKDAQKTDAKQSNKNLLLSKNATVNANPELEIFADDVRCTHGATIGNLDEEQLFYLRARGLDADTARGILTYGFASEVIGMVKNPTVRSSLDRWLFPGLPQGARLN